MNPPVSTSHNPTPAVESKPNHPGESYRSSHLGKGEDYHRFFQVNPYPALLWRLERKVLDRIMADHAVQEPPRHLDFACGTGRIVGHLASRARESVGLDVSDSMLEVARRNVPTARFFRADITSDAILTGETFDLITAFRFFLNAEQPLRERVIAELARRLAPGGILVFNNHGNESSLTHKLLRRARPGRTDLACLSHDAVGALVSSVGLRIVAVHHLGVLPATEKTMPLPSWVMLPLESVARRIPALSPLANDLIYVCARA